MLLDVGPLGLIAGPDPPGAWRVAVAVILLLANNVVALRLTGRAAGMIHHRLVLVRLRPGATTTRPWSAILARLPFVLPFVLLAPFSNSQLSGSPEASWWWADRWSETAVLAAAPLLPNW